MRTVETLVFSALLLVGACLEFILASPANNDKRITAVYIEGQIVLDGNLDEPEWSLAQPATDFIQNDPDMGEPATERTEVRILYNNEYLYLGVYCFDSAGREGLILNQIFRDVGSSSNDSFSFVLDTFDDDRNAFLFGMNPAGSKRDGQFQANGQQPWRGRWSSTVASGSTCRPSSRPRRPRHGSERSWSRPHLGAERRAWSFHAPAAG